MPVRFGQELAMGVGSAVGVSQAKSPVVARIGLLREFEGLSQQHELVLPQLG